MIGPGGGVPKPLPFRAFPEILVVDDLASRLHQREEEASFNRDVGLVLSSSTLCSDTPIKRGPNRWASSHLDAVWCSVRLHGTRGPYTARLEH